MTIENKYIKVKALLSIYTCFKIAIEYIKKLLINIKINIRKTRLLVVIPIRIVIVQKIKNKKINK